VARAAVSVRRVSGELEHEFTELWTAALLEAGASVEGVTRAAADGRVRAALDRPDVRAYLAVAEGQAQGFVLLTHCPFSDLVDSPRVSIERIYVAPPFRRHGVARQLLGVVAGYAESLGCEQVGSTVPAHDRDANRFFARLGFGSQTVRRAVGTTALLRRVSPDRPRSAVEQLLEQRRRALRARKAPVGQGVS
jgi:GNAT superfamily N-acetyltransferase